MCTWTNWSVPLIYFADNQVSNHVRVHGKLLVHFLILADSTHLDLTVGACMGLSFSLKKKLAALITVEDFHASPTLFANWEESWIG